MSRYLRLICTISAGLIAVALAGVDARAATPKSETPESATGVLEEVIVSATRRDENIQKVPMQVTALSADQMETRGIQRVEDVVASTPNVMLSAGPSGAVNAIFAMRGIPGAGIFVDGVWQESAIGLSTRSVMEMESVEVLRGPQGTLFGRDTTGGAIRLFTKPPADVFGVRAEATVGSYDRRDLSLNVDLPIITDKLLSKLTFGTSDIGGYVCSITVARCFGDSQNRELRLDFLWRASDRLKVRLTGERSTETGTQANYTLRILDSTPPGTPVGPGFGFQVPNHEYYRVLGINLDCQHNVEGCPGGQVRDLQTTADFTAGPGIIVNINSLNLKADYRITDNISLSSLTSYSNQLNWDYENFQNSDIHFFSQGSYEFRHGWTQEFQLTGHEGKFHWLGGLYGWHDTNVNHFMRWAFWEFQQPMNPGAKLNFADVQSSAACAGWTPASGLIPCIMVPSSSQLFQGTTDQGEAAFGELSYDLTNTLTATFGARYHKQKNSNWNENFAANTAQQSLTPGALSPGNLLASAGRTNELSLSFSKATYHFALTNKFTDDLMGYLNFSQGYNSGGDSRVTLPEIDPKTGTYYFYDQIYAPETINNYEIGIKSDWLNHRLRVNVTYFITDWKDIQISGTVKDPISGAELPTFLTQNEAGARAKGVEIGLTYVPTAHLLLHADVGTLDTKYTEILPGATNEIKPDSKFGMAPTLQYSVGAQWTSNLTSNLDLLLRGDYNYNSGYDRSYVPGDQNTTYTHDSLEQHAFGLLAARVAVRSPNGRWELAAFGTNLSDKRYTTGGFFSPLLQVDDGTIGRPREFGVSFKTRFE